MITKFYKRDYDSNIWFQISFEYFQVIKQTAYLTWWSDDNGKEVYEFCCNISGIDQYVEVVSSLVDSNCSPEHIAGSERGYKL